MPLDFNLYRDARGRFSRTRIALAAVSKTIYRDSGANASRPELPDRSRSFRGILCQLADCSLVDRSTRYDDHAGRRVSRARAWWKWNPFRCPRSGPGELLIRVEACGICHTDLKKIEYNLLAPPRIYGHETAGVVAAVGAGVTRFSPGDRVIVFHHIPCGKCFYCQRKLYAQCPVYKKVGVTAGL